MQVCHIVRVPFCGTKRSTQKAGGQFLRAHQLEPERLPEAKSLSSMLLRNSKSRRTTTTNLKEEGSAAAKRPSPFLPLPPMVERYQTNFPLPRCPRSQK